jgi:8-oxo-dGTP pyrophosphatase MutT (NUDIX family)
MRRLITDRLDTLEPSGDEDEPTRVKVRGDNDLNPGAPLFHKGPFRPAAVLVPIIERPEGMTVLLTKRTDHLHDHAGQISFPGGRVDDCDESPVHAALRETHEEVGIDPSLISVAGRLATYRTVTGYAVVPFVGFVVPDFTLRLDAFEVAEAFEVPLEFLIDETNHQRHSGVFRGVKRHWYAMPYEDYYIWGATAGMLVDLTQRLRRGDTPGKDAPAS